MKVTLSAVLAILYLIVHANACITNCPHLITIPANSYTDISTSTCSGGNTMILDWFTIESASLISVSIYGYNLIGGLRQLELPSYAQGWISDYHDSGLGSDPPGQSVLVIRISCSSSAPSGLCSILYGIEESCKSRTLPSWRPGVWTYCQPECYLPRVVACESGDNKYLPVSDCAYLPKPSSEVACFSGECVLNTTAFRWVSTSSPTCDASCNRQLNWQCIDHNNAVTDSSYCDKVNPVRPIPVLSCGSCDASDVSWHTSPWSECDGTCVMHRNRTCMNALFTVDPSICYLPGVIPEAISRVCTECKSGPYCTCSCSDGSYNVATASCDTCSSSLNCPASCSSTCMVADQSRSPSPSSSILPFSQWILWLTISVLIVVSVGLCCWCIKKKSNATSQSTSDTREYAMLPEGA